jgi:hypothetical protein
MQPPKVAEKVKTSLGDRAGMADDVVWVASIFLRLSGVRCFYYK